MRGLFHSTQSRLGAVLLCGLALAALAAGCGGGDESESTPTIAKAPSAPKQVESGPTEAVLQPVGDSKASGTVHYLKKPDGTPLLKIRAQGLEPTTREEKYVIWQISSPQDMVPLATYTVGNNGRLNENLNAGFESIAFLEDGSRTELVISKVGDDDLWREGLGQEPGTYNPAVKGQFILQGPLTGSLVGAGATE
jgi:hypothetical protein